MGFESIVSATKDQVSAEISDEVVILNLKTGIYFGLNPIGAFIWRLIQNPLPISSIQAAVLNDYDVDPESCEKAINDLLQQLAEHGLIEVTNAPDSQVS
jgi:hypothetical protein